MAIRTALMPPAPPELYRYLDRALAGLRWATLAALALLTLAKPLDTRLGVPNWALLGLFAGYRVILIVVSRTLLPPRALAVQALLDLPVSGLIYWLSQEPGGPLFNLLLL